MATHSSILAWRSMDRGACWATVHRAAKSQTHLKWPSTHALRYLHPRSFRLTLCVIHINSFFLPRCDFTVVCVHVCLGPKTCPPTHLLRAPPQTLVRGPQACACVRVSEPGSGSSDPRASCGIPSVGGRLPHSTLGVPAVGGGFVSFRI